MRARNALAIAAVAAAVVAATTIAKQRAEAAAAYKVVGWNDLGMHCMDSDYSVFSILPPFNTVQAQVIGPDGKLVRSNASLRVTYEATADSQGSINRTSRGKTNYWRYAQALYGGSSTPDVGLAGHDMPGPSNLPQPMAFDQAHALFQAIGVPITPYDDGGHARTYPMMRLVARDALGTPLAATHVVLPVSDEMDCSLCHASGSGVAARPKAGWVDAANALRDYRLNILRLHDEKQAQNPVFQAALQTAGYAAAGLYATVVQNNTPILCARTRRTRCPVPALPASRP